jgi:hypothetical protein
MYWSLSRKEVFYLKTLLLAEMVDKLVRKCCVCGISWQGKI